ncbi:MAG: threo-3-hydroxy-L-aspartate ammonia-lyase [Candidatus Sumerlaeota bacterium]|nr:threo-3-hydroxy-L-aspartate ammonia-lyase [Candidatus Sumerlaeota bacterium]
MPKAILPKPIAPGASSMPLPPVPEAELPTYDAVQAAARRLDGVAHRTPVVTSRLVDERTGARVFFKCENLQRIGAFKFRGAYNALSQLAPEERRRGVITFSSGNHAQAVALSGALLGIPATIVMPQDAPPVKITATRAYGAEVVLYDRATTDRQELGARLAAERGLTLVPPYDHPAVLAGQGTAARELFEDAGPLDVLLVPVGGGGLLSGCSLVARALAPECRVLGCEPAAADDAARSFASGTLQTISNPVTIADGAQTPSLGRWTFPLIRRNVDGIRTVGDAALASTMFWLWERLKLVIEPTGALGAAVLFESGAEFAALRVGVIISGGNVDLSRLDDYRHAAASSPGA